MAKRRRPGATEVVLDELDNNTMIMGRPLGKPKQFDDVYTDEVCCGSKHFIYEGDLMMIGKEGKELTFNMN
jgi:hypothetical protein